MRQLYEHLLEKTQHVKVWPSYAKFQEEQEDTSLAQTVFERADKSLQGSSAESEQHVLLLEAWRNFEMAHGDADSQETIRLGGIYSLALSLLPPLNLNCNLYRNPGPEIRVLTLVQHMESEAAEVLLSVSPKFEIDANGIVNI